MIPSLFVAVCYCVVRWLLLEKHVYIFLLLFLWLFITKFDFWSFVCHFLLRVHGSLSNVLYAAKTTFEESSKVFSFFSFHNKVIFSYFILLVSMILARGVCIACVMSASTVIYGAQDTFCRNTYICFCIYYILRIFVISVVVAL